MCSASYNDCNIIAKYIFDLFGVVLGDDKQHLIEQRLTSILPELDCKDFSDLVLKINSRAISILDREKIVNAITTGDDTSFFRDPNLYAVFKDIIMPDMVERIKERKGRSSQRRGSKVTMWSIAANAGQEPYSMAMLISDFIREKGMDLISLEDFKILGTDISSEILSKAIEGRYNSQEVSRGLTHEMLRKYFVRENDLYVINDRVRRVVKFKSFNIQEPFVQIGSFDVIFCRNVLIYFTDDAKRKILSQLYQVLAPGGCLLLDSAENMNNLNEDFKADTYSAVTIYRKIAGK